MSRLLLASNRLPVTARVNAGKVELVPSMGGLVTGLAGPHRESGGSWFGWLGADESAPVELRDEMLHQLAADRFVPIPLSRDEVASYYHGFSNGVLWPIFHYLLDRLPLHCEGWEAYQQVNERFATMIAKHWQPGDVVWIHDYHLCLVPALLRRLRPEASIGFFLHVPFPASDVLRILPFREQILEGLLGADLIGFHTHGYRSHFAASVLRILGLATRADAVRYRARQIRLGVFPMGIDGAEFEALAADPAVGAATAALRASARGCEILLAVDRLDYTKGIPQRLLAFEQLLEREPGWRERVRLVQVAVPSRQEVESYRDIVRQIDQLVGRINGRWATVHWTPVRYIQTAQTRAQIVGLYRASDVMLVTPLRDGMNLVAKEFVASRTDEDGVLVLSEFAGAAAELAESLQVNPYDIDALADGMNVALKMPEEERRLRMRALRRRLPVSDVHRWAHTFLAALRGAASSRGKVVRLSSAETLEEVTTRLASAERLLMILDYDGTLMPFASSPALARPDPELLHLLDALSKAPGVFLHVASGRPCGQLSAWLGQLPIGLHAEHGFWSREAGAASWTPAALPDAGWDREIRGLLDRTAAEVPGSLVEQKTASIAWHYRMVDAELGAARSERLFGELEPLARAGKLHVLRGARVIEVQRPEANKARLATRLIAALGPPPPCVCAIGDDETDEMLFAVHPEVVRIVIGFRPSAAKIRLRGPKALRVLLGEILKRRATPTPVAGPNPAEPRP